MILVRLSTYYVIPIATSETSGSTLNNRRTENAILLTFEPKKNVFLISIKCIFFDQVING